MGISGRKVKQRIPNDPRNLSWADDASRFGSAYLSKLGFDHSNKDAKLGLSGSGLSKPLKVHHKLDMFGIGAQHTKDPNGLAWKQNRDFENLLKRLNSGAEETLEQDTTTEGIVIDGFHRSTEQSGVDTEQQEEITDRKQSKKRKREKESTGNDNDDGEKKKKKKKEKKVKAKEEPLEPPEPAPSAPIPYTHYGRAHRARFIASKRLAASSSSSTAISEILGIPSSSATPNATSNSTSGITTPQIEDNELHKINVSSTSIGDYFKEKMKLVVSAVKATDAVDVDGMSRGGIVLKSAVETEADSGEESIGLGMKSGLGMRTMMRLEQSGESQKKDSEELEEAVELVVKEKRKKKRREKTHLEDSERLGLAEDVVERPRRKSKQKPRM